MLQKKAIQIFLNLLFILCRKIMKELLHLRRENRDGSGFYVKIQKYNEVKSHPILNLCNSRLRLKKCCLDEDLFFSYIDVLWFEDIEKTYCVSKCCEKETAHLDCFA